MIGYWRVLCGVRENVFMRYQQLQLFTRPVTVAMRDRTRWRNYSLEKEEFRVDHARRRRWGLRRRHARKLCRLHGCSRECGEVGLHDYAEPIPPLIWPAEATLTRRPSPAVPSRDVPAERDLPAGEGQPTDRSIPTGGARPAGGRPAGGARPAGLSWLADRARLPCGIPSSEQLGLAARTAAATRGGIRAPPSHRATEQTLPLQGMVMSDESVVRAFSPTTGISRATQDPDRSLPLTSAGVSRAGFGRRAPQPGRAGRLLLRRLWAVGA